MIKLEIDSDLEIDSELGNNKILKRLVSNEIKHLTTKYMKSNHMEPIKIQTSRND